MDNPNDGADEISRLPCPDCDYGHGGREINMGTHLTLHVMHGHLHPAVKLLETPSQWVPCVFRWSGNSRSSNPDYFLRSQQDLYAMALWVMDWVVLNLRSPTTVDDYDAPREHWNGWFSPADHDDVVHDLDYERFRAIQRSRQGSLAWWWLQRHYRTVGLDIQLVVVHPDEMTKALPVPTDPPPTPILWLTAP